MTEALIVSQTLFYFVVSAAIISVGILLAVAAYHLVRLTRNLERISENMKDATEEIKENIEALLGILHRIPFLSFLFKKGRKKEKDRKEHNE